MKTKTLKQILATTLLATTLLITNAGISKAALQANTNTQYTKKDTPANCMTAFRQMETAGGAGSIFSETNSRYFDTYTTSNTSAKIGDALGTDTTTNPGCALWHSTPNSGWVGSGFFLRGYGGIFSFNGGGSSNYYCRGVAVCGQGL